MIYYLMEQLSCGDIRTYHFLAMHGWAFTSNPLKY